MRLFDTAHRSAYLLMMLLTLVSGKVFGQVDGSLDTTFDPDTCAGQVWISSMAMQPDGKILVGGSFSFFNNTDRTSLVRLNPDGTSDSSFNTGSGISGYVYSLALQHDGKIIAGGVFDSYNHTECYNIVRLNADGTLDTTFKTTTPYQGGVTDMIQGPVHNVILQPDHKILLAGAFSFISQVNGGGGQNIARLHPNGTPDTTFKPEGNAECMYVYYVAMQRDGKILLAGDGPFTPTLKNIIRLNADGTVDSTFKTHVQYPGTYPPGPCTSISMQPDEKIIVTGGFETFYGVPRRGVVRLNTDGSVDTTFNPGSGLNYIGNCLLIQADEKVIVGGSFASVNGITRKGIARLNPDGSVDTTFNPFRGADGWSTGLGLEGVNSLLLDQDGELLVAGNFTYFNGIRRKGLARLHNSSRPLGVQKEDFLSSSHLSPNPAHPGQTLHLSEAGNTLRLTDIQGRSVATLTEHEAGQYVLPGDIAPGYYLLTSERGQRYRLCIAPR